MKGSFKRNLLILEQLVLILLLLDITFQIDLGIIEELEPLPGKILKESVSIERIKSDHPEFDEFMRKLLVFFTNFFY